MLTPTPPLSPAARPPGTTTVLVVDDSDDTRGLLRAMLLRGAHRIAEAQDGEEALDLIGRTRFDLIVLDVNLPGIDGPEVCRRVKTGLLTRSVPVVMLTAATNEDDKRRCLEAGADAYLTKPFSPLKLLDLLEAHLGAA